MEIYRRLNPGSIRPVCFTPSIDTIQAVVAACGNLLRPRFRLSRILASFTINQPTDKADFPDSPAASIQWLVNDGARILDAWTEHCAAATSHAAWSELSAAESFFRSSRHTAWQSGDRQLNDWQIALLRQQIELRKRAKRRFPGLHRWLWTDRSLSQASDWNTAVFKASLFPPGSRVVDACCGAGADLVALASRSTPPLTGIIASGIELEADVAAIAAANLKRHGLQADIQVGRFPDCLSDPIEWLHIDPDRRPADRRTQVAEEFQPPLSEILEFASSTRGTVIKLAPSTVLDEDVAQRVKAECQRLWIGNQGECRQQLLLTGEVQLPRSSNAAIAPSLAARTAVLLPHDNDHTNAAPSPLFFSATPQPLEDFADRPLRYIYDLHATLHASELHNAWAEQNQLRALGGDHGYFTGEHLVASAWSQAFELMDVLPWDDRQVRKWLRKQNCGLVEVKSRLHRMDAASFQKRYSQPEGCPVTVLVTLINGRVRALASRRLPPSFA